MPPERIDAIAAFLDHWHPDIAVFVGYSLPPALIAEADARGIPLILADARTGRDEGRPSIWRRSIVSSLLSRFAHVLVQDPETGAHIAAVGGRQLPIEVTGRIEETTDALPCNEAERGEMAELLRARPVWLAVACPETEEAAVIDAQAQALRLAHRMLLIVVPAHPSRGDPLAERASREGWVVARRSRDEEPDNEVQVFLADDDEELGLWYRLAPVTYMGGTLNSEGSGRNPFEPAALGSAIIHGPNPGPYPDAYTRLRAAQATRLAETPAALTDAVCDLIAPDKAAILAHNAWAASSGGAEVTERVARILLGALDTHLGKVPS